MKNKPMTIAPKIQSSATIAWDYMMDLATRCSAEDSQKIRAAMTIMALDESSEIKMWLPLPKLSRQLAENKT